MRNTIAIICIITTLCGCSSMTVHFEGQTPDQIQTAYERIFHSPPSPPKRHSSRTYSSDWIDFDLDFNFTSDFSAYADAYRIMQCLGFWEEFSEQRWKHNRYERCYSTWWLIIPVKIDSEKATVKQVENGVDLTIELYPGNKDLLKKRFAQVRTHLGIKQP